MTSKADLVQEISYHSHKELREIMIIVQSDVRLADPHICSDARNRLNIFTAIFDALVRRDDQGNFIPALASSWQVQPDARHWQFQLRQDVRFHNGDNLTSADVVASL
ncbi:MAG: hypothetical protein KDE28_25630, partial [Anaerolineales bacterium]|nr:hypothetical protein [Anaerolineales bacterium]